MTRICNFNDLLPERPAAALVDGHQLAIVRLHDDRIFAVDMWDPFARANVMARGLVGSVRVGDDDVDAIFSPMYKQAFDLRTGVCLSDPEKALGTWAVAVLDGRVFVGSRVTDEAPLRRPDEAPLRRPEEGLARAG